MMGETQKICIQKPAAERETAVQSLTNLAKFWANFIDILRKILIKIQKGYSQNILKLI